MALLGRRPLAIFALLLLGALPLFANPYVLYIGNLGLIYVILAVGLNLLVGYAGQLSFANAALFGIGAYGTGLLQVHFGLPFWAAWPAGALLAAAIGTLIAIPALRLSGLYLALATLAFAQFTQWVFLNWDSVTFGAGGFRVPVPNFAPLPLPAVDGIYYVSLLAAAALVWLAANAVRSRIGRALVAIRDGEVAAEALGIDLLRYKTLVFAVSAFYAGVAGGLYSAVLNFVAPEGFDLYQVILQKAMIVVGGIGSVAGAVIGAGVITLAQELLRGFKGLQEIAFGATLLLFVLFLPSGIVSLLSAKLAAWREPLRKAGAGRPILTVQPAMQRAEEEP